MEDASCQRKGKGSDAMRRANRLERQLRSRRAQPHMQGKMIPKRRWIRLLWQGLDVTSPWIGSAVSPHGFERVGAPNCGAGAHNAQQLALQANPNCDSCAVGLGWDRASNSYSVLAGRWLDPHFL